MILHTTVYSKIGFLSMRMAGIRKGTSRAPSPTVGSGRNHPEGIHSCAMAQFMVKPIHAPRQFMPARAIHWPRAVMPPPAGCHVRNRKCLTTPPVFCPDKKPPPLTRGGMGAVRTRGMVGGAVLGREKDLSSEDERSFVSFIRTGRPCRRRRRSFPLRFQSWPHTSDWPWHRRAPRGSGPT